MELLKALYEIYSPSNGEKKIKKFIKRWVGQNVPDAVIRKDNNDGNIYIVKGDAESYPCIVAHLDQVQHTHSADFKAEETDDIIFGYSPSNRRKEGLGADDKNGIWVALKCLEEFDGIKVAFFVGEEIGCEGSSRCDMQWFNDVRFVVEPDRRGATDLIVDIGGRICSDAFEDALPMEDYGYKPTSGAMTDVMELSDREIGISCINLSCGYYNPHTDDEFTVKEDLRNCLNFVKDVIRKCTDVYPHKRVKECGIGSWDSFQYPQWYNNTLWNHTSRIKSLPKMSDYADVDSFISQLVYQTCMEQYPEELWYEVSSDLETYGVTEDEFLDIAYKYFCEYTGWSMEELGM